MRSTIIYINNSFFKYIGSNSSSNCFWNQQLSKDMTIQISSLILINTVIHSVKLLFLSYFKFHMIICFNVNTKKGINLKLIKDRLYKNKINIYSLSEEVLFVASCGWWGWNSNVWWSKQSQSQQNVVEYRSSLRMLFLVS